MDKVLDSFMNETNNLFSEFISKRMRKNLENREDYLELKTKRNNIYEKFSGIRNFIEDGEPMNFGQEETEAFYQIVSISEEMRILEIREVFKLGAKEAYIFFEEQDMLNI